jgi:hypothetical protein
MAGRLGAHPRRHIHPQTLAERAYRAFHGFTGASIRYIYRLAKWRQFERFYKVAARRPRMKTGPTGYHPRCNAGKPGPECLRKLPAGQHVGFCKIHTL